MPELRRDPFTRSWVIIAPDRADRPRHTTLAAYPDCPFCPGHEQQTPGELWRWPTEPTRPWKVRVVPNRYPVLAPSDQPAQHCTTGAYISVDGVGGHEVVVESPDHDWDLADGDDEAVADVLRAYRARTLALRARRPGLVLPFRNHGEAAGTSLSHPHSQIVATPVVPLRQRRLFDIARAHYDDHGSCLYTDLTNAEIADGRRVVAVGDHVAALAPYAATAPFETWILPFQHQASFADIADSVLNETAAILRRLLAAVRSLLGDVPYNYALISAPNGEESTAYFAWHLQLVPRLVAPAGFELGTGIAVNPVPPEQAAAQLREELARAPDGTVVNDSPGACSGSVPTPTTRSRWTHGRR